MDLETRIITLERSLNHQRKISTCLLYTSDAADEL